MSDDSDDYMSSTFLGVKDDICPGLVKSKILKRKYEIEKKEVESNKLHYTKPRKLLEEEQRNSGMDRPLNANNKGFCMLQKMGYKPGMKLGKQAPDVQDSGLKEPIKVALKSGRGGLGQDEVMKKKEMEREQRKLKIKVWKEKETKKLTEEYRQRMKDKVISKQVTSDLRKCQKVCEQLDIQYDVLEPQRPWFWFSGQKDAEDHESDSEDLEDDESLEPDEKLYLILDYLRNNYFYCLWCGTKYDNEKDMVSNCPGIEKDDHE